MIKKGVTETGKRTEFFLRLPLEDLLKIAKTEDKMIAKSFDQPHQVKVQNNFQVL